MNLLKSTTLSLLFLGLLITAGCDKDNNEIVESVTPKVTATVSGNAWEAKVSGGVSTTVFVITATKDKEAIVLTVPSKATGEYVIDGVNNMAYYTPDLDSLDASYIAYSGKIVISDINFAKTQFNGSFEFEAISAALDTIHVKNGVLKNIPAK